LSFCLTCGDGLCFCLAGDVAVLFQLLSGASVPWIYQVSIVISLIGVIGTCHLHIASCHAVIAALVAF